MKWLELKLDTSPAGLEAATQLLEEQGRYYQLYTGAFELE